MESKMIRFPFLAALVLLPAAAYAQGADAERFSLGGDDYVAGQTSTLTSPVSHDAFMAGFDVSLQSPVTGDAHLAGYNVNVAGNVGADLYAVGFGINVSTPIAGDVTAAGNSIVLLPEGSVGGNLRLGGQTVTVDAPVAGSALVAAQTATLASTIGGDFQFSGVTLNFSSDARVDGTLTIRAPRPIDVPATVASADRVVFQELEELDRVNGPAQVALETVQSMSPWVVILPVLVWNLALLVIGLIGFAVFPNNSTRLYQVVTARPWFTWGVGFIALSALIGAVVVLGMTIIGLPLIPVEILVLILAWILAQIAGAYLVGSRILTAFRFESAAIMKQLAGLFVGLVVLWLVGLIPIIGYLVWFAALVLGFGAMARLAFTPVAALRSATPTTAS
jgi:hypothetical protein